MPIQKFFNCDYSDTRELFSPDKAHLLKNLFKNKKLIIIDEAQRVKDIGLTLKIIADEISHLKVIATGSSSFELAGKINEPLTGHKKKFLLLPFSIQEILKDKNHIEKQREIANLLIFGSYPEVYLSQNKKELLTKNYRKLPL